jgi:glycosyltransferase involved in cell wall biosynthesis
MDMSLESLKNILPVHNAEQRVSAHVAAALELATELTPRFEIAIVDDGSTDHTEEIACDLALRYPQIHVARHYERRGLSAAIRTAMLSTWGTVAIAQPLNEPLRTAEIRRLWQAACGQAITEHATPLPRAGSLIDRLVAWGQHVTQPQPASERSAQLIRRSDYLNDKSPARFVPGRVDEIDAVMGTAAPNFLGQVRSFAMGE